MMRVIARIARIAEYTLVAFIVLGAAVSLYGLVNKDAPVDVAVVLGSEVYADGTPAPRLAARLDRAVELFYATRCRMVIVSGGVGKSGQDEATAMGLYLRRHGVPARNIIYDHKGVNTWETARFASEYMRRYGFESAIVVSQYFHIARSEMALRFMGVGTVGTASPWYFEWRDVYSVAREVPGIAWYCARFFLSQ